MRHFSIVIVLLFFCAVANGQNPISEARKSFATFGARTTKVVVPSTTLADLMLRDAVNRFWRISPFEFCSFEEYEKSKQDTSFYFLMRADGLYRKELEPKIEYLTLFRGGEEGRRGLRAGNDIINLPLQPSDDLSGDMLWLLPTYINIIQDHIYAIQQDISLAFKGTLFYSGRVNEIKGKRLLIAKEQIGYSIDEEKIKALFKGNVQFASFEQMEEALSESVAGKAIAVAIKPKGEARGSYCYKMVISTEDLRLLFFRRHKVSGFAKSGFTKEDLRKMSAPYLF